MIMKMTFLLSTAVASFFVVAPQVGAQDYNATTDFSISQGNPNGVWSYGWMPTDFSSFNLYTQSGTVWNNSPAWFGWGGDRTPHVALNTDGVGEYGVPPGWLDLHPGNGDQPSVIRWTAPAAGDVTVVGEFLPGNGGIMDVAVRLENQPWWSATDSGAFNLQTDVTAGETIDFAVYGGYGYGDTPISADITLAAPDGGLTVLLLGMSFAGFGCIRRKLR
jgi:hypothetical protein